MIDVLELKDGWCGSIVIMVVDVKKNWVDAKKFYILFKVSKRN